jgi:hypothetical protein
VIDNEDKRHRLAFAALRSSTGRILGGVTQALCWKDDHERQAEAGDPQVDG